MTATLAFFISYVMTREREGGVFSDGWTYGRSGGGRDGWKWEC